MHIVIKRKEFAGQAVLADLAITIKPGQFVTVCGQSGVGKTTLLNIIAGLDEDYEGEIRWHQGNAGRIGYVFQEALLLPWLTVYENLKLVAPQYSQSALDDWLDEVNLSGVGHKYPRTLSGGMQRRVALLRALIVSPDLLLLDEPFISLDQDSVEELRALCLRLWQRHQPMVMMVTHDYTDAVYFSDVVVQLAGKPCSVERRHVMTPSRRDANVDRDLALELQRFHASLKLPS